MSIRQPHTADRAPAPPAGPRDVVRRLGPAARSLILARAPAAAEWAPRCCLAIAEELAGRRPRTLLLDLEGADGRLDDLLGVEPGPGLTAVFRGEAGMADVAVRPSDGGFLYLPAGRRPAPPAALLGSPAMAHLLDRARDGGATVLLYAGTESLGGGQWLARLDGCIQLGDPGPRAIPRTLPVLGRVPAPSAGAAREPAGSPPSDGGGGGRRRSGLSRPVRPPGAGAPSPSPGSGGRAPNRGLALDPEAPAAGSRPVRWWQLLVVCALAAALGLGIVWADSRDLWSRWIIGDGKTPAASTQR